LAGYRKPRAGKNKQALKTVFRNIKVNFPTGQEERTNGERKALHRTKTVSISNGREKKV